MDAKFGYLLPTREAVMEGRPETGPLFDLAARADDLGYDSVWIGDSLLAKPRHEPLTLLAGVAGRSPRLTIGTAVLLPILRNPVVLAHQVATLDQVCEGRLLLGIGIGADIPPIRAEVAAAGVPFEKRLGRTLEGIRLCRALWTGEPVDWDGRWKVEGGVLGPTPYRKGGPPIWIGGSTQAGRERAGRHFDGWMPISPDAADWAAQWEEVRGSARDAGRDPDDLTGSIYLTLSVDDDKARAEQRLDSYLEQYYGQPAEVIRRMQSCFAGSPAEAAEWLGGYARAGVAHFVLRFAGDHERHLEAVAAIRAKL